MSSIMKILRSGSLTSRFIEGPFANFRVPSRTVFDFTIEFEKIILTCFFRMNKFALLFVFAKSPIKVLHFLVTFSKIISPFLSSVIFWRPSSIGTFLLVLSAVSCSASFCSQAPLFPCKFF